MNPSNTVSAIVPARNEQGNIARAVRSLAAQPEIGEIVVVNDQSTDGTAEVLARLAAEVPHLHVFDGEPLPAGWVGKNHAVWQGAQHARGAWLLFTDADAVHLPGSTATALAVAEEHRADIVSFSPAQEMHTWWERALIPFVYWRLAQLYSYERVNDPQSPSAAANGQYLLIRRQSYEGIGGHAAVYGEVLEDVALARRAKAAGLTIYFAPGEQIARVRMYSSFRAMWEGWTKNLYPLVTVPGRKVFWEIFSTVPLLPLMCILLAPWHLAIGAVGIVLLAGRHAFYAGMLRRNRFPVHSVLYYLVGVVLYVAALSTSEWHYARGKVAWKGREYDVKDFGT